MPASCGSYARSSRRGALERPLMHRTKDMQVITRFNFADFVDGVSDIAALRRLLKHRR